MFERISAGAPSASTLPLVEDADPVADLHDQRHVVIDQEDADVVVRADRADDRGEVRYLRLREAGGRLVEQQEARTCRERARHAEPAFVAVAQRVRRGRSRAASGPGDRAACLRAASPHASTRRRRAPPPRRSPGPRASGMRGCAETCARAHGGRADAATSPSHRRRRDAPSPESGRSKPLTRLTSVDLPAPFGPIRPTTSPRPDLERDAGERLHTLEGP